MTFYEPDHFKEVPVGPKTRELIAKIANLVIDSHGTVIYGNKFDDGTFDNYSTTNDDQNTHTGILIGGHVMGEFPLLDSKLSVEAVTERDIELSTAEENERLKAENTLLSERRP